MLLIAGTTFAQTTADKIIGTWNTGEGMLKVQKEGQRYIGHGIKPDGSLGTVEILNVEYKKDHWEGELYSKKKERTLDAECELHSNQLLVPVSAGWVSKELEWTRVK